MKRRTFIGACGLALPASLFFPKKLESAVFLAITSDPYEGYTSRYVTPTGAGAHNGTSWADAWTLNEAAQNASAKQRVWLEPGTYSTQIATSIGATPKAILWLPDTTNGTDDNNRIVFDCATPRGAILDGGTGGAVDPTAAAGVASITASWITVRNLEIKNCNAAGWHSAPGAASGLTLENCYVHDITRNTANVGCVKFDDVSTGLVKNNKFKTVSFNGTPDAGFHSFRASDTTIENNEIWDVGRCIFWKQSGSGNDNIVIRNNILRDTLSPFVGVQTSVAGAGNQPVDEISIYENLMYGMRIGCEIGTYDYASVGSGIHIYRNTFATSSTGAYYVLLFEEVTDIDVYNNIIQTNRAGSFNYIQEQLCSSEPDYVTIKENCYHSESTQSDWYVCDGGSQTNKNFTQWKTELTGRGTSNPEQNSIEEDPQLDGNYEPQNPNCSDMGHASLGNRVGPNW